MVNILIVDDEPANLELLEEILVEYGCKPTTAQSIEEAVALGTTQPFDVVLMDMALPQRRFESPLQFGGLDAVRQIQAHVHPKNLKVIAVTAQGMPEARLKILAAGIEHIVEKSIDMETRIVRVLEEVLSRRLQSTIGAPCIATSTSTNVANVQVVSSVAYATAKPSLHFELPMREQDIDQAIQKTSELMSIIPDPKTGADLRKLVGATLDKVKNTVDRLVVEAVDTERDSKLQPTLSSLSGKLELAARRLFDGSDGPTAGETHGHWIVNLAMGAARDVQRLKKLEEEHHFGGWATDFAAIAAGLEQAFQAAKGPAGLERNPPLVDEASSEKSCTHQHEFAAAAEKATIDLKATSKKEISPEQRLILIVDDNPEARRDLEEKLQQLHYRVVSCANAKQALLFVDTMRFDVCLVDLDMPEINGLDLIKHIRNSTTSSDASIIVVSGSPELFTASDAIDGGADDYLEKPANTLFLQARIRSCLRQSDSRLAELSHFLPEDVAKRVSSNRELLETAVPADISVMVCDIRGFSRVSERVGPMRTITWISDVMNRLSKIILSRGGTIIDYVGDEIMAMWGAPIASQDHATDACNCALAVQRAVEELSAKWLPIVGSRMQVGVGINSGLAVVGNTGSKDRIKFGPLGNTVNLASRVQGATKYLHSSVLITQETAGRIDGKLRGRRICAVRVQNIMEPVDLFELRESVLEEASASRFDLYAEALKAFEDNDLDHAISMLARLLAETPTDGPAKLLMMRAIQNQLGGTFDPIWTLPGK